MTSVEAWRSTDPQRVNHCDLKPGMFAELMLLWNQYRVGLRFMLLWCFSQLKQNVTYFHWDTVYFGITAVEKLMTKLKLLSAYMRLIQTADIVLRRFTFSFYALIIYSWLILYMLRYWRGYLSGVRCKWFASCPADATATPWCLVPVKSRMVYLSDAGLPGLSWNRGR